MSWVDFSIDSVAEVVTKGTTPTTYGMPFTEEGVNFIKAEALNGDATLDNNGFAFISEDTHEKLKRSQLCVNDVLITIAGANVGKCGIVREQHIPANTNQAVGIIRVDPKKASPRFIYYCFKNPRTFAICQGMGGQAAQPNINLTVLKSLVFSGPVNSEEQEKISDLIAKYDDLIENNRRRMQLLEESARLLYQEWFVHLRFPGHEHIKITDGVPEGWENKTADKVMEVLSGGTPKTKVPEFWDGETPFFTPKDAKGLFTYNTEKTITELGLSKCNSRLYPKNTVFITARGTVGKLALAQRPMAMNQSCYALIAKGGISQEFLYSSLKASIEQFKARASGAVFDAIVVDTFKNIPFLIPLSSLRDEFTEQVKSVFSQIDNLSIQNMKLVQARDLLLPKLMSGELTV